MWEEGMLLYPGFNFPSISRGHLVSCKRLDFPLKSLTTASPDLPWSQDFLGLLSCPANPPSVASKAASEAGGRNSPKNKHWEKKLKPSRGFCLKRVAIPCSVIPDLPVPARSQRNKAPEIAQTMWPQSE